MLQKRKEKLHNKIMEQMPKAVVLWKELPLGNRVRK